MSEKVQEEHKPLTLTLEIDEKEKRFVTPKRIPGVLWRQAAVVADEIETGSLLVADLDSHMQFVCDVYGNQFTLDEFENGVDSRDMIKVIYAVVLFVMGQVSRAARLLTKNIDSADIDEKKT